MPKNTAYWVIALLFAMAFPARCEDWRYTVRPGDNLWTIAELYLESTSYWQPLQRLNAIHDPWHIPPGTTLRIPVAWMRNVPVIARIHNIEGTGEVLEEGSIQAVPAHAGELLVPGDAVKTGSASHVTLEFVDGSQLMLQPDSLLRLDQIGQFRNTDMTDTRLHLQHGRLETQVARRSGAARRFEITTPGAVTSVRGTDYRVSSELATHKSLAEVIGGRVAVSGAGKTQMVAEGYGTVTLAETPPQPPVPLLSAPDISGIGAVFARVPISLKLPKLAGATGYRLQIAADGGFDRVLFDQTFPNEQIRGPDFPDGEYRLRVRGVDERGLEGLNVERHFTLNARPEAPFPIEPKPGAGISEETPRFVWSHDTTIQSYHLQVAHDDSFRRVVVDRTRLSDADLTLDRQLGLGKYYWRVASIDAKEGEGPFSDAQDFRRVVPAPEIGEPEIEDEYLMVRWRAGLPGQRYQFQLSEDASFSKLLLDTTADRPQQRIDRPAAGEYYMRIRTIDADGFVGPYGKPQTLEVPRKGLYWILLALPLFALFAL